MSDSNPNIDRFSTESKTGSLLQIYTVAHAVRSYKIPTSQKLEPGVSIQNTRRLESCKPLTDHHTVVSDKAMELKETIKIKQKINIQKQPSSTLPMKMIVSKKATRKADSETSPDEYDSLDLSACRNYKLTPPSWQNRNSYTKRRRPTESENILEAMKKRCVGFNTQINTSANGHSLDLESSVNCKENILLMTPPNEHAFSQLCGKKTKDHKISSSSFDQKEPSQWSKPANNHSPEEAKNPDETFVFNPRLMSHKEPEFVWNPVILKPTTTYQNPLFNSRNESSDFLQGDRQIDLHCRLNCPSPVTPSSSSSGLTVEEETLRCTLFTNKDFNSYLKEDYHSSVIMPRRLKPTGPHFRNKTYTNYPNLPELYRFYEE